MRILHLHVKYEYWDLVISGKKKVEYRVVKPYWTKRLKRKYDVIYYYRGYTKDKMVFEYKGYTIKFIKHKHFGKNPVHVYAIKLT